MLMTSAPVFYFFGGGRRRKLRKMPSATVRGGSAFVPMVVAGDTPAVLVANEDLRD